MLLPSNVCQERFGPMPAASAVRPRPLALKRPVFGLDGLAYVRLPDERLATANNEVIILRHTDNIADFGSRVFNGKRG